MEYKLQLNRAVKKKKKLACQGWREIKSDVWKYSLSAYQ